MEMINTVEQHLLHVQDNICRGLQALEGGASFTQDRLETRGGYSLPRILQYGRVFERAAVLFSRASGPTLPPAATENRPQAAGKPFHAVSVSLIVHPQNPFVPTTHANFRCFVIEDTEKPVWWVGGGYDLTPYYVFEEDVIHWHTVAKTACDTLSDQAYAEFKSNCDAYFFLPHRQETRGVGGVFFDDLYLPGEAKTLEFLKNISTSFVSAYLPIVEKRSATPFTERERKFQLYRRGRYAEFNLLYDRGTRYGLQSGGTVESILASMPPLAAWEYQFSAAPDSPEAKLNEYLKPRDWV